MAYVTLAEVRALVFLADVAKFPDAALTSAVAWFEEKFEGYVGVAFAPRAVTERLDGSGCSTLILGHYPIQSVTAVRVYSSATASTAFTGPELADLVIRDSGVINRYSGSAFPAGTDNIAVDYVHGFAATPADVKDACLVAVREKLLEDATGARENRQFAVATEAGVVRTSLPGPDRPFGLPSVDQVANSYRERYRVPAIA